MISTFISKSRHISERVWGRSRLTTKCDPNDFLKGPYFLPETIENNDYIEIDLMGAYTLTCSNDFNGFFSKPTIYIKE